MYDSKWTTLNLRKDCLGLTTSFDYNNVSCFSFPFLESYIKSPSSEIKILDECADENLTWG